MATVPGTPFGSVRSWLLGGLVAMAVVTTSAAIAKDEDKEPPLLKPWHTVVLQTEFRAGDEERIKSIADYQALETRLFADLEVRSRAALGLALLEGQQFSELPKR